MKLICINDKQIQLPNGTISYGLGLVEGELYEYSTIDTHWNGRMCYNIKGLGYRQVARFREVDGGWVDELEHKLKEEAVEENLSQRLSW